MKHVCLLSIVCWALLRSCSMHGTWMVWMSMYTSTRLHRELSDSLSRSRCTALHSSENDQPTGLVMSFFVVLSVKHNFNPSTHQDLIQGSHKVDEQRKLQRQRHPYWLCNEYPEPNHGSTKQSSCMKNEQQLLFFHFPKSQYGCLTNFLAQTFSMKAVNTLGAFGLYLE